MHRYKQPENKIIEIRNQGLTQREFADKSGYGKDKIKSFS